MVTLNIVLALVIGFGTLATISQIHRKRQPITPTIAIISVLFNALLIYALLNPLFYKVIVLM